MSETNGHAGRGEPDPERDLAAEQEPEELQGPHRVIGTPAPAEARTMLPGTPAGTAVAERELPAEPDDPATARRAAKVVSLCFIIATVAGLGFIAAYVIFQVHSVIKVEHSNLALGLTMGLAFIALGVGAVIWVRHLMPNVELTEQRHPMRSTPENKAAFAQTFAEGAEASQFVSQKMVRRTLIAATGVIAIAPLVVLRDMGPLPQDSLDHTVWKRGTRLVVYATGRPLTPAEFNSPGSSVSVIPQGYADDDDALAKAATTLIKFAPGQLMAPTVMNWTVDNIVAYSKICTHLGCPAALYEQTTHHILCPCHQSTFAADQGAIVLFGPATRPLPQLPLMLDSQGYLAAASDYHEAVGPSFWERG